MKYKYILSIISILILFIFNIYIYKNSKNIKEIEERIDIENKIKIRFIAPFFVILYKNFDITLKLINSKLKIILRNLYGDLLLNYNITLFLANKIMYLFYFTIIFFMIYPLINNILVLILVLIFIILINFYFNIELKIKYSNYKNLIKNDLPNIISRLSLLIQAGIPLRKSIDIILINESSNNNIYLREIDELVKNGLSERKAYDIMISRSDDILIRKFLSLIIQNLEKGSDTITQSLDLLKKETDEFRRTNTIIKTQEANRKLLIPNIIIFIGIMLMIMIPILINIL